jgi:hypothetical protein
MDATERLLSHIKHDPSSFPTHASRVAHLKKIFSDGGDESLNSRFKQATHKVIEAAKTADANWRGDYHAIYNNLHWEATKNNAVIMNKPIGWVGEDG